MIGEEDAVKDGMIPVTDGDGSLLASVVSASSPILSELAVTVNVLSIFQL